MSDIVDHCKDCCCARAWKALGITEYTGRSIPDEIVSLRQELDIYRLVANSRWQPIETAPKANDHNDANVLVFNPAYPKGRQVFETRPDGEFWRLGSKEGLPVPTKWMPLPEPPGDE